MEKLQHYKQIRALPWTYLNLAKKSLDLKKYTTSKYAKPVSLNII